MSGERIDEDYLGVESRVEPGRRGDNVNGNNEKQGNEKQANTNKGD